MSKLKFFKEPKNYWDYRFWKAWHHEKAVFVFVCALAWLLAYWLS